MILEILVLMDAGVTWLLRAAGMLDIPFPLFAVYPITRLYHMHKQRNNLTERNM